MNLKLYGIILTLFISSSTFSQKNEELFPGENELTGCVEYIPLTYKKKTDKIVAEKAKTLENKELILLQYHKSDASITYTRYYLISEVGESDIFNYLKTKEDFESGAEIAIFLKFTPKFDRFYLAKCFDQVLSTSEKLSNILKEEKIK